MTARYTSNAGQTAATQLLDLDLQIVYEDTNQHQVAILISDSELRYHAIFSLATDRYIHASPENEKEVVVDEPSGTLEDYLNTFLPVFYTADLGSFSGWLILSTNRDRRSSIRFESIRSSKLDRSGSECSL